MLYFQNSPWLCLSSWSFFCPPSFVPFFHYYYSVSYNISGNLSPMPHTHVCCRCSIPCKVNQVKIGFNIELLIATRKDTGYLDFRKLQFVVSTRLWFLFYKNIALGWKNVLFWFCHYTLYTMLRTGSAFAGRWPLEDLWVFGWWT